MAGALRWGIIPQPHPPMSHGVIILDPLDTAIVFWIAASALSFILALFVSKKSHA